MQGSKEQTKSELEEPEESGLEFFLKKLRIGTWAFLVVIGFQ